MFMNDNVVFFFKQKTSYEMRISDWSSDVCSSDLHALTQPAVDLVAVDDHAQPVDQVGAQLRCFHRLRRELRARRHEADLALVGLVGRIAADAYRGARGDRSEEHTSELQSLMRISYAVFCLKKKNKPLNLSSEHSILLYTLCHHHRF